MCDLNCVNLIDLSLEHENKTKVKTENEAKAPAAASKFIPSTWRKTDSLENNPFDFAQKLADRPDDPFDIVEKEACMKAQKICKKPSEVKLGNLLSLSDDNLMGGEQTAVIPSLVIEELSDFNSQELDLQSPPVLITEKHLPDTSRTDTDSTPNSSAEASTSAKLKKNMEQRKRLLKMSISNAAFNSPTIYKQCSEYDDALSTPVSSMFSRAAEFGEHSLTSESPLKMVEDEDLLSEERPNFVDSEKNFEADLEMMKIPILNDLPSPAVEQISIKSPENSPTVVNNTTARLGNALPNIEEIKAKLKAKKEKSNNNHQQEISSLIQNLKTLISCGEMTDKNKEQASALLESLSSALKPSNVEDLTKTSNTLDVPQPIKRQDTFDVELQEKGETNIDNQPLVQDMPSSMVSSSATYDGEHPNEKQHLNLPEIVPLSPQNVPNTNINSCANQLQTDVNDIMEQLSKLLINNSVDNQTNCNNPTFIVVMNANQLNHSNNNSKLSEVDAKLRSEFVSNYFDESINDGSPDLTKVNTATRRRSQSLSIHDKVKIVRLPVQVPTPSSIQRQNSVQLKESEPITTTPPSGGKEIPEFKTPARLRRNSYSSGTPYTTQVGMRRIGFGSECKNTPKIRRTQALDTHHEAKEQVIVKPLSMPSNNMLTFKPDLKKKAKHSTESIMKSSGPLKATIPVKKVAPMLKTSPSALDKHTKPKIIMPATPLPARRISTLGEGVDRPSACSTPDVLTSPLKRTTGPINKARYSYMSTTPNTKSSINNSASSTSLKSRTITEFKSKSPLKQRASNLSLAVAVSAPSSRSSVGRSRLSISAGARITKTPVKTTTGNAPTAKPISRISSRVSVGGSSLPARNKENKRP